MRTSTSAPRRPGPDDTWVTLGEGFATMQDTPREPAVLGQVVSAKASSPLVVNEYVVRGNRVLGRFARVPATLGLAAPELDDSVRVEVRVAFDETAEQWWRERVAGLGKSGQSRVRGGPHPPPLRDDPAGPGSWYESSSARLLRFHSPRALDTHCLLPARRDRGQKTSYGLGVLTLPAGHLAEGGLLLVRVEDAVRRGLDLVEGARHGSVGLRLIQLCLEPLITVSTIRPGSPIIDAGTAERNGWLSTGGADSRFAAGPRRLDAGALVVGPTEPEGCRGVVLTVERHREPALSALHDLGGAAGLSAVGLDGEVEDVAFELEERQDTLLLRRTRPRECRPAAVRFPMQDREGQPLTWTVRGLEITRSSPHFRPANGEGARTATGRVRRWLRTLRPGGASQ